MTALTHDPRPKHCQFWWACPLYHTSFCSLTLTGMGHVTREGDRSAKAVRWNGWCDKTVLFYWRVSWPAKIGYANWRPVERRT